MENKYWIAFANAKMCNHYKSLVEQGFINWRKSRTNFQVGDIVYLFSSVKNELQSNHISKTLLFTKKYIRIIEIE